MSLRKSVSCASSISGNVVGLRHLAQREQPLSAVTSGNVLDDRFRAAGYAASTQLCVELDTQWYGKLSTIDNKTTGSAQDT